MHLPHCVPAFESCCVSAEAHPVIKGILKQQYQFSRALARRLFFPFLFSSSARPVEVPSTFTAISSVIYSVIPFTFRLRSYIRAPPRQPQHNHVLSLSR